MSGPEWDEKIKRLLRSTPPEVDAVDFAAIREAARREASRRSAARSIWKILAIAAAVLIVVGAALRVRMRPAPKTADTAVAPAPRAELAPVAPPQPRPVKNPAVNQPPVNKRRSLAEIDRQFAEFVRVREELRHPLPAVRPMGTRNPNVQILLLEESEGVPQ